LIFSPLRLWQIIAMTGASYRCVSVFVCMYVCDSVCCKVLYTIAHAHTLTHTNKHTHIYMWPCLPLSVGVCWTPLWFLHSCPHTCARIQIFTLTLAPTHFFAVPVGVWGCAGCPCNLCLCGAQADGVCGTQNHWWVGIWGGSDIWGVVSRIFPANNRSSFGILSLSPFDWHPCWVI
jgi:hypothetical protein